MPESRRERVFATTLDVPGANTRLLVYSDMNARWYTAGGQTMAATPCREGKDQRFMVSPQLEGSALEAGREQKCFIPETAASCSLSNFE
jgi:hypothetical protein